MKLITNNKGVKIKIERTGVVMHIKNMHMLDSSDKIVVAHKMCATDNYKIGYKTVKIGLICLNDT